MKILVFAHRLDIGGAQINSIELASELRDVYDHDVTIFATAGPLEELVLQKKLRYIPAPRVSTFPSLKMMKAFRHTVRNEKPDVVHAWDWIQGLDAFYGMLISERVPLVISDMFSDGISRFMPKNLPITYGTPEFVDLAKAAGRRYARLCLPPVDIRINASKPGSANAFRRKLGVADDEILIVTISRLAKVFKSESLSRTIEAMRVLCREAPAKFLVVGDGEARGELELLASSVNSELGMEAVFFSGELVDPEPAYEAADIVVGMGGSALRGMAFEKPVVVVGAAGFSEIFSKRTAESFLYHGIYGSASPPIAKHKHVADLRELVESTEERRRLGVFGRQFVAEHFSLPRVAASLNETLQLALDRGPGPVSGALMDAFRTAAIRKVGRIAPRVLGRTLQRLESKRTDRTV